MEPFDNIEAIRTEALRLGFDRFGVARAEKVSIEEVERFDRWIERGDHASMHYMTNHREKRLDPRLLMDGAQSIVVVAMNYYPAQTQPSHLPQVSYYAYGRDYHEVIKERLNQLLLYIKELIPDTEGHAFVDSAPLLERYWASRCGIGWIGRSGQLITPAGSYFFLGELVLTVALPPTDPIRNRCGRCRRCIEACPSKALNEHNRLNAHRCLSYRTIEHRGAFAPSHPIAHGNRLVGCDECQKACPWNRFSVPSPYTEFSLRPILTTLDTETIEQMSQEEFSRHFAHSPIKRVKLEGLKRNAQHIRESDVEGVID